MTFHPQWVVCSGTPPSFVSHGQFLLRRTILPEPKTFKSYKEFFAFYLEEHSDSRNRLLHAIGTFLGLAVVVAAFIFRHPIYALTWPIVSYGFAWTGHFLIERNKPATFGHPFWSFISDFQMLWLMLTGRLEERMANGSSPVIRE